MYGWFDQRLFYNQQLWADFYPILEYMQCSTWPLEGRLLLQYRLLPLSSAPAFSCMCPTFSMSAISSSQFPHHTYRSLNLSLQTLAGGVAVWWLHWAPEIHPNIQGQGECSLVHTGDKQTRCSKLLLLTQNPFYQRLLRQTRRTEGYLALSHLSAVHYRPRNLARDTCGLWIGLVFIL